MTQPPIQSAATLIILRDSEHGPEVLLQQRNPQAVFVGGAWVFPGGRVDDADRDTWWDDYCAGLTNAEANRTLGTESHGLSFWVAAIREAFEEAGLLYVDSPVPVTPKKLHQWRLELLQEQLSWQDLISTQEWQLQAPQLHYLSRWITPPGPPRRFDTRFFLSMAPEQQTPSHDNYEAIATRWMTPETALAAGEDGDMTLIFPTLMTLRQLQGHPDCATLLKSVLTR